MTPTPPLPAGHGRPYRIHGLQRPSRLRILAWLAPCAMAFHLTFPGTGAHMAAPLPQVRPCHVTLAAPRHNHLEAVAAPPASASLRLLRAMQALTAIPASSVAPQRAQLSKIIAREDQAAAAAAGANRAFAGRRTLGEGKHLACRH